MSIGMKLLSSKIKYFTLSYPFTIITKNSIPGADSGLVFETRKIKSDTLEVLKWKKIWVKKTLQNKYEQ